ncbi:MAG: hypothetical protein JWM53_5308, partial [bacterium]|nr:hypothetical protein [bacterium]
MGGTLPPPGSSPTVSSSRHVGVAPTLSEKLGSVGYPSPPLTNSETPSMRPH